MPHVPDDGTWGIAFLGEHRTASASSALVYIADAHRPEGCRQDAPSLLGEKPEARTLIHALSWYKSVQKRTKWQTFRG